MMEVCYERAEVILRDVVEEKIERYGSVEDRMAF
jgi:hypothetical protein